MNITAPVSCVAVIVFVSEQCAFVCFIVIVAVLVSPVFSDMVVAVIGIFVPPSLSETDKDNHDAFEDTVKCCGSVPYDDVTENNAVDEAL